MKKCELCNSVARVYCESDQASLCWECDSRVHTANFLVAKHSRTLLCHGCQSPTPWTGSGPKLGPTVSVCEHCVNRGSNEDGEDHDDPEDEDENYENEGSPDEETEDEDDGDNQVVPLSSNPLPPPLVSSSSSSEESSSRLCRNREGISSSSVGFHHNRADQNARFSYDGAQRNQDKDEQRRRSWTWR